MRKVFEDDWLQKNADKTPEQIRDTEGRKSLAILAFTRDQARKEELRFKAALFFAERFMPAKDIGVSVPVVININAKGIDV